jgi:molecular chaperone DnaK
MVSRLPAAKLMARSNAVGIDLGTTYSAVAYLDDLGRPTTLVNAEGDLVTPSVVLLDGQQPIVGKEALKALATDALDVVQCVKREMGRRLFPRAVRDRRYPPEVLQALILSRLRRDAARLLGEVRQAVITVPAYFDDVRRKATQDAGYMAGLEVLDILNEPTAAALAHGLQRGFIRRDGSVDQPLKLLVYDLGGGTFDVTVMEISAAQFVALATDGDVQLGGYDWDRRLVEHVAEQFQERFGHDPRQDPNAAGRLWRDCEDAKRTLSARAKATIPCEFRGQALRVEVSRATFEDLTRDLLDRTAFTARQALQAAGLLWKDLDHVLLVGGSTRMPMVAQMLQELTGRLPDASVAVDEAVAHGAAIHAGLLLARGSGQQPFLRVRHVNSHSLSVVGADPATGRPRTAVLIPRNTGLPVSARRVFRTQKAGQRSILVPIVEGESADPDQCTPIGRCAVRNLPPDLPAQSPIEVQFVYADNGRLSVTVRVAGATEVSQELLRQNGLSPEQLDAWRTHLAGGEAGAEPPQLADVPDELPADQGPWS